MTGPVLTPDVLCIGESMLLVAPTVPTPLALGATLTLHVAGAESNVAMDLAALGFSSAWASLIGPDRFGEILRDHIASSGVDVSLVGVGTGRTGVFFKDPGGDATSVIYYRDGSAASLMGAEQARSWAQASRPRVVHVSGITSQLGPGPRALVDSVVVQRAFADAVVSFDVNYRSSLAGSDTADQLLALARQSDVVFVGADEARAVWGVEKAGLADLFSIGGAGPSHLIVKDADLDATEITTSDTVVVPALSIDVLEPVGAGDAFAAGWLGGFLDSADAGERLARGHAAAAVALRSMSDTITPDLIESSGATLR
ncbi:sugar kinase [Microbacterium sp.]|uniref:sugar kinase n=1 Tax=Microbacterium sp. TaxID=51671 RepID=UPI002608A575|nr:sugar kinase [Microbacterium sp.]